jgi:hypothetical protein
MNRVNGWRFIKAAVASGGGGIFWVCSHVQASSGNVCIPEDFSVRVKSRQSLPTFALQPVYKYYLVQKSLWVEDKKLKKKLLKVQRLTYVPPGVTQNLCIFFRAVYLYVSYDSHNKICIGQTGCTPLLNVREYFRWKSTLLSSQVHVWIFKMKIKNVLVSKYY